MLESFRALLVGLQPTGRNIIGYTLRKGLHVKVCTLERVVISSEGCSKAPGRCIQISAARTVRGSDPCGQLSLLRTCTVCLWGRAYDLHGRSGVQRIIITQVVNPFHSALGKWNEW